MFTFQFLKILQHCLISCMWCVLFLWPLLRFSFCHRIREVDYHAPCFSFLYDCCIYDSLSLLDLCVDNFHQFLALFLWMFLLTLFPFFGTNYVSVGLFEVVTQFIGYSVYVFHSFFPYTYCIISIAMSLIH